MPSTVFPGLNITLNMESSQVCTHHAMFFIGNPFSLVFSSTGIIELSVAMTISIYKVSYIFISQRILRIGGSL